MDSPKQSHASTLHEEVVNLAACSFTVIGSIARRAREGKWSLAGAGNIALAAGPLGDSELSLGDGETIVQNRNDAIDLLARHDERRRDVHDIDRAGE